MLVTNEKNRRYPIMIQTICPECGNQMEIPAHYLNHSVVCVSCRKNFTAYRLNQASPKKGSKNNELSAMNKDQKTDPVDSVLNPLGPMDPERRLPSVILMLPPSLRQGSILGGWICFGLGIIVLFVSTYLFFLYVPLFLASFILSVIAIAQRNILNGVCLLLLTIIAPWFTMGLSLMFHAELSLKKELKNLQEKKDRFEAKIESMKKFEVIKSSFAEEFDSLGIRNRVIELSVYNGTDFAISKAFFRGVLALPERSVPLIEDTFSYQIRGGIEPGERVDWLLEPNMFSDWGKVPIHQDAEFAVTVVGLEDADGADLFGDASFSKYDQERLLMLEKKFNR
jgi:hypothetical protein